MRTVKLIICGFLMLGFLQSCKHESSGISDKSEATLKDPSFKEILDNAKHDIEVDSVKYFTGGLPFIAPKFSKQVRDTMSKESLRFYDSIYAVFERTQSKQKLIEGVREKYGLHKENLGCMISKQNSILEAEYKKITEPYLEKRNGKGWEEKMNKEINSIRNKE